VLDRLREETLVRTRRTTIAVVTVLGLATGATGCAAGRGALQDAKPHVAGVNADLPGDSVLVRNLYATPESVGIDKLDEGTNLQLHFHAFNHQSRPDVLVALSSPDAAAVRLSGPGVTGGALPLGANRSLAVGDPGGPTAELVGLTKAHLVGTYITVTMSFGNAGTLRNLVVPINPAEEATESAET
jgi:hypothetical protein